MNDPLSWSLHLGRWAGIRVRLHFLLLAFVAVRLLDASLVEGHPVGSTGAWLLLLLLALLLHELGHIFAARRLGVDPDEVQLWPLGNLILPGPLRSGRNAESVIVAATGLIVSGTLALGTAIALNLLADVRMVFNPFGNADGTGAPIMPDGKTLASTFSAVWWFGWFGYLNWVLFLANLIPALPMDMGRVLRALTESPWSASARDGLVAAWTARVCAVVLAIGGLIRIVMGSYGGLTLCVLGLFLFLMARLESRMLEEGGFYDDSLFGYDFSQGYTSLEGSAAVVRPKREGALSRWRRRRSDQRKRRLEAKAAAEELRMDEILQKIHRDGRAALTAEEQRFLVRVSARYKSRTRSRG